jgi:hypothetical protein
MTLTNDQIKEIAEQLDCGFRCFIHKQTNELIFIPDTNKHPDIDLDAWADENDKIETNFFDYYEIEPIESHNSFKIMEDFIETLDDSNSLKEKLYNALNKNRPFRNFKNVIDFSGEFRQKWFDFKHNWLMEWVRNNFERLEGLEKFKNNNK